MKRFRVALITNKGLSKGESFDTFDLAEEWLLAQMELPEGVKLYRIMDRKLDKVIEDEKGKRKEVKNG